MKLVNTLIILSLIFLSPAYGEGLKRQSFLSENFSVVNKQVAVAFFDADSTLRVSLSGSVSANSEKDVMLLPWVETKIAELVKDGYLVAIVSNQGGIKVGAVTHQIADGALFHTIQLIQEKNPQAKIHYFDYAEGNDESRKPGIGMAMILEQKLNARGLNIDWKNSFMVGDSAYKKNKDIRPYDGKLGTHFSNSDRLFAENLNIPFYEAAVYFGWRQYGIDVFATADEVRAF